MYNFQESEETKKKRQVINTSPINSNQNAYEKKLSDAFDKIKSNKGFQYDPTNDELYKQYASQAMALNGLAIGSNQKQAQALTGGYGSSYAPLVAQQGKSRINAHIEDNQPAFYSAQQDVYNAELENDLNKFSLTQDMYSSQAVNNAQKASEKFDTQQRQYESYFDSRDKDYQAFSDKKNYQFSLYDTYNSLAGVQCAKYNEKKDNKSMKSYLNGLVEAGKLTQYMADNLYNQYKYVAPKSTGGRSGDSSSNQTVKPITPPNTTFYFDTDGKWKYGKKADKSLVGTVVPDETISNFISGGFYAPPDAASSGKAYTTEHLKDYMNKGIIDETARDELLRYFGLA